MNISIVTIPGLPNGVYPLNSRRYHNPYPAIEVIKKRFKKATIHNESYLWPREIKHPWGHWTRLLPGLTIPIYYFSYLHFKKFREKIIQNATKRLKKALQNSDITFVIAHSHGNLITLHALLELQKQPEKTPKKRLFFISQAPAYSHVAYGLIEDAINDKTFQKATKNVERMFAFRIETDLLSGTPTLPHLKDSTLKGCELHCYHPHWYELIIPGHDTVRSRKDILKDLQKSLQKI